MRSEPSGLGAWRRCWGSARSSPRCILIAARSLAWVLGACSSLATLVLQDNGIGDDGVTSLAQVLGQCSSLATLDLRWNDTGDQGATSLAEVLGKCSSLVTLNLRQCNAIGAQGIEMIRTCIRDTVELLVWVHTSLVPQ